MDHLAGNVERGLAGDEQHAAPAGLGHARRIVAREPHAAQHIDLEQAQPVGVGNLECRLALVDAEVVDQDVDLGQLRRTPPPRPSAVAQSAAMPVTRACGSAWRRRASASCTEGSVRPVMVTCAPSAAKPLGNGEADAAGRARHERAAACRAANPSRHSCFPGNCSRQTERPVAYNDLTAGDPRQRRTVRAVLGPRQALRQQCKMTPLAVPADPAAAVDALARTARKVQDAVRRRHMVWRVWGSGEPLVLFHGGSGSWTHWIRNIPELSQPLRAVGARHSRPRRLGHAAPAVDARQHRRRRDRGARRAVSRTAIASAWPASRSAATSPGWWRPASRSACAS